jgi:hypothetical protein
MSFLAVKNTLMVVFFVLIACRVLGMTSDRERGNISEEE